LIDLGKKVVAASESKNTSKNIKNTQSEIENMNDTIRRGFKNSVPKD